MSYQYRYINQYQCQQVSILALNSLTPSPAPENAETRFFVRPHLPWDIFWPGSAKKTKLTGLKMEEITPETVRTPLFEVKLKPSFGGRK